MSVNSETADQTVKMTLEAIEEAAKVSASIGGVTAKSLAAMIYAMITDNKKTHGKTRLNAMLKSGKELKVLAIHHKDLEQFCKSAKQYGVLYCVLKEKNNTDGIVDIMVRAEDASKISRMVDKFDLATINTKVIRESVLADKNEKMCTNDVDFNDTKDGEKVPNHSRTQDIASEKNLDKSKLKKNKFVQNRASEDMNLCYSKKSVSKELRTIQNKIVNNSSHENLMSKTKIKRKER